MSKQLTHTEIDFKKEKFPIVLITDRISSPANLGSLLRIADAFHIEKIMVLDSVIDLNSNRLKRTARSTEKMVCIDFYENLEEILQELSEEEYQWISLEITEDSFPVSELKLDPSKKIALIVGEERSGVHEDLLAWSKNVVHIPMFGNNSSMNVAQAAGICLYEMTKKIIDHR
ncbi:TrmH family RNA methyltransferase [Mesonia sp.]|uniref:TrmH family RNA methyltransferase n=1 Tax=Mesonia sp. TaxID=1960830 RepID=UPI003F98CC28